MRRELVQGQGKTITSSAQGFHARHGGVGYFFVTQVAVDEGSQGTVA